MIYIWYVIGCSLSRGALLGFTPEHLLGGVGLGMLAISVLQILPEELKTVNAKLLALFMFLFPLLTAELHPLLMAKMTDFIN